jgi:hypothetical protein
MSYEGTTPGPSPEVSGSKETWKGVEFHALDSKLNHNQ